MDYGKFKYERDVRQKEARKKQSRVEVKEIKMRPKIDPHDYGTKKGHVERFLKAGARVKVTIMFRGREMAHTELGRKLLDRLTEDLKELATVETYPKLDGRNMVMVMAPDQAPPAPGSGRGRAGGHAGGRLGSGQPHGRELTSGPRREGPAAKGLAPCRR